MKKALSYHKAKFGPIGYCFFLLLFSAPVFSFAQTKGKVEVIKDPLIDTLIAKRSTLLKTTGPTSGDQEYGFRVQIFFGSNRQAAYSAQAKFRDEYPEFRTYISYTEPNFRVQAGDFRTRLEAEKLKNELTKMFTSLFIISQKINPPKTDSPDD
jgi:hypothetical protein